jgi:putative ABC transport system ATP-binding protein
LQGKASPAGCRALLSQFGLANRLDFLPFQLSAGEKQRVCLARGLASAAPLLLVDEPTANLDGDCVSTLVNLFREATQRGRSLLVASNDSRLLPFADRTLVLKPAVGVRPAEGIPA